MNAWGRGIRIAAESRDDARQVTTQVKAWHGDAHW